MRDISQFVTLSQACPELVEGLKEKTENPQRTTDDQQPTCNGTCEVCDCKTKKS